MNLLFFWIFLWSLCFGGIVVISERFLPQSEYDALYSLYNSTQGDQWTWNSNYTQYGYPWNFTIVDSDPCSSLKPWQGVNCSNTCDANFCHIFSISLPSYRLNGSLPSEIGNLTYLEKLVLPENTLNGSLPEDLYRLQNLIEIVLFENSLIGSLSPMIGQLSNLRVLELYINSMSGPIPSELSQILPLEIVIVSFNSFSGNIPNTLGNLTSLLELRLDSNLFTGTLPSQLSHCTNLRVLQVNDNFFTGTFPYSWTNLTSLLFLDLYANLITGIIPPTIGQLKSLQTLSLESNLFTGSIPSSFTYLYNLSAYSLSSNQITGTIPSNFGNLINTQSLTMDINYISGTLPISIGNLTKISSLSLNVNYINGTLPHFLHSLQLQILSCFQNMFTGTIPSAYNNLTNLYTLDLDTNYLTGSIPHIDQLIYLEQFYLFSNKLTGTIPHEIGTLSLLLDLLLFDNLLTGSLPASLSKLRYISIVDIENNLLSGSIPATYNQWYSIAIIYFSSNSFSGTIPSFFFYYQFTTEISLLNNFFTGSIPSYSLSYPNHYLEVLDLSSNLLTNSLPNSILNMSRISYFSIGHNYVTDIIPKNFLNQSYLSFVEISDNYLIGTLPSVGLSLNDLYTYVDFSSNLLTGIYPYDIYQNYFTNLFYMNLANNFLTGSLPKEIGGSNLKVLYLQNNSFSGSISSELVSNKNNLTVFMASLNCLTGTIPESLCENHKLTQLILDGLHSSDGCIDRLFSFDDQSSYSVKHGVHGTIPACLFSLPYLQIFHLSGNNLHGTIPFVSHNSSLPSLFNGNISHLRSLILANNLLTGTIPSSLWTNQMIYLDLSFNQFTSSDLAQQEVRFLSHGFPKTLANLSSVITPSLRLQVNHLSGRISSILTQNISLDVAINILEGNMYSCNPTRHNLPSQDPNYETYQCGSDYTNISLYFAISFFLLLLVLIWYFEGRKRLILSIQSILSVGFHNQQLIDRLKFINTKVELNNLLQISQTLTLLGKVLLAIILWTVMVLIPTYIGLSQLHGTYDHQYVWVLSSAYLSGQTPAIVMLLLLLFIVALICYLFLYVPHHLTFHYLITNHVMNKNEQHSIFLTKETIWKTIKLIVFIFVETGIVLLVNFSYVLALNHGYDNITITWISLAVSSFKLLWGNFMLLGIGRLIIEEFFQIHLHTAMIIAMSIFNNVIAPYLAEALVSSNCFYYAITSSPTVNSYYYPVSCNPVYRCYELFEENSNSYYIACSFQIDCNNIVELFNEGLDDSLTILSDRLSSSSYHPPFHYNYTCSSSLLSAFVYIFVYRYLFTGIIEPLLFYCLKRIHKNYVWFESLDDSCLTRWSCGNIHNQQDLFHWITKLFPVLMKFEDFSETKQLTLQSLQAIKDTLAHTVSPAEKSIVRLITDITVMLSFGVLFPPLGILIFISLIKDILREQQLLGYLYQRLLNSQDYLSNESIHDSIESQVNQLLQDILIQINNCYRVWITQFWMGWWWSVLVAVWFWSFSLYDTLARESGPVRSIWIILVMGLSPLWMRGLWSLIIRGINMILHLNLHESYEINDHLTQETKQIQESIDNPVLFHSNKSQKQGCNDLESNENEERLTELTVSRESILINSC